MFETPVLFLIFNRPDTTVRVFAQIKKVKPKFLFVAADGPRKDKPAEKGLCREARDIVLKGIDWDCELKTLFREENLGCGKAPANAITWFFENVHEGIILEDDCVPDETFFTFCSGLLDRYRLNEKIMHIGGNNFQFGIKRGNGDYYYSALSHIWGWATWSRAWQKYEFSISNVDSIDDETYSSAFDKNESFINYYKNIFSSLSEKQTDIWDYQWLHTLIRNNGIAICPNVNLVQNIGFGKGATHTLDEPEWNKLFSAKSLHAFQPPSLIKINYEADAFTLCKIFGINQTEIKYSRKSSFQKKTINFFLKIGRTLPFSFKAFGLNIRNTMAYIKKGK